MDANGKSNSFIDQITSEENFGIVNDMKQQMELNTVKNENNPHNMESNVYGLVEDAFLVNDFNPDFSDIIESTSSLYSVEENMQETLGIPAMEKKPFESFEKQITISVPQPPPLKAEAFTIGGGLFDGKFI